MADIVRDPVCGMEIRPQDAAISDEYEGGTFHFCSHACHAAFVADPDGYAHSTHIQVDEGSDGHRQHQ